jgi:hypothetical protein
MDSDITNLAATPVKLVTHERELQPVAAAYIHERLLQRREMTPETLRLVSYGLLRTQTGVRANQ